jgi:hypothetical protein
VKVLDNVAPRRALRELRDIDSCLGTFSYWATCCLLAARCPVLHLYFWEWLLHVSTLATTRVALPTEIEPRLITYENSHTRLNHFAAVGRSPCPAELVNHRRTFGVRGADKSGQQPIVLKSSAVVIIYMPSLYQSAFLEGLSQRIRLLFDTMHCMHVVLPQSPTMCCLHTPPVWHVHVC